MNISKNKVLGVKNSFQEIQTSDIITADDVLRSYENIFKRIEKMLENSGMSLYDFEVGKRKNNTHELIYFYADLNYGFISLDELGGIGTHKLEDILDDLYAPRKIRDNLIPLLKTISQINQRKIHKLNSELGFVKDFPI